MSDEKYTSLIVCWTDYEAGIRRDAEADHDDVDENFLAFQKVMFFRGAGLTLEILNRAGLINEDTMPVVTKLATEIRSVRVSFPGAEDDDDDE